MTNSDITTRLLDHMGLQLTKGSQESLDPAFPWFIMDIQYQLFCKYIAPLSCGHDLQKLRTRWKDSYNKFNSSLFSLFNLDEKCEIVDLMSDFEESIQNDIEIARIQFMNVVQDLYESDIQEIIAGGMMCNILAQDANIVYKKLFKHVKHGILKKGIENPHIASVEYNSFQFTNLVHQTYSDAAVKFMGVPEIDDSINVLGKKIGKWIKEH